MDLQKISSIHFVGIKGVAMTALAILAQEKGLKVSGSDIEEEFPTDETLRRFQIKYSIGFSAEHIPAETDLVIYTGAHQGSQNPEVAEAVSRGIMTLPHGKALGEFMKDTRAISVAGSHGKTTTSAMITSLLVAVQKDPSFAIGCGEILQLKTSGHNGKGDWFVAEADEYVTDPGHDATPRFMWQNPEILVITNIDYDHPDVYQNLDAVKAQFGKLIGKMSASSTVIVNLDDEPSASLIPQIKQKLVTYGRSEKADIQIAQISFGHGQTTVQLKIHKKAAGEFVLKVPGVHNAYNATASIAAALSAGLTLEEIREGIGQFVGTKRRFEFIAEKNGKLLYDDYAHHPVEIAATLSAVRKWFPRRRIIAIFQPHTYSRTQSLLNEFAASFSEADMVIITDIYASARETPILGISGELLWQKIATKHKAALFQPGRTDVVEYIDQNTQPQDLILTMGAGNIYTWLPDLVKAL